MAISNFDKKKFIILSKPFYFGWLLAFPLYGPVFNQTSPFASYAGINLVTYFLLAHALTYIIAGFFLKNIFAWQKTMQISVLVTLVASLTLLLDYPVVWPLAMLIMGAAASIYILAWSVIYSMSGLIRDRIEIMALVIISGNLVLFFYSMLANFLTAKPLILASSMSLLVALLIIRLANKEVKNKILQQEVRLPISWPTLIVMILFTLIIYLNGGFVYRVMLPQLTELDNIFSIYYPCLIYIIALLVIYGLRSRINRVHLVYLGVSFVGLAFIAFALFNQSQAGYFLTIALMETSFALLDLFLWITMASLAYIFGAPYLVFGLVSAANVLSIHLGDMIGLGLASSGENINLILALASSASILVAIIMIPWLLRRLDLALDDILGESAQVLHNETSLPSMEWQSLAVNSDVTESQDESDRLLEEVMLYLDFDHQLTSREEDVLKLVLLGLTNKAIADQLFISEHTIKTHLRNIYNKFDVTGKKELIYLANRSQLTS